jgi:AraC family transcriptional regulator
LAASSSRRLNPPITALGHVNAVMGGLYPSRRGHALFEQARDFEGPLSLKVVLQGQGQWQLARQRCVVDAGFCLVLNRGEAYSLTFDPAETVETFCPFFAHGFAEAAVRSLMAGEEALLDAPTAAPGTVVFAPHVRPLGRALTAPLVRLHQLALRSEPCDLAWDDAFVALSLSLVHAAKGWRTEHLDASHRPSTRGEITRRLDRARDFIHAEAHRPLVLAEIAAAASLSPHHFHRLFTRALGATPGRYVTQLRLARAARRLAATEAPVTEICLAVGFESLGSFSARFHRRFGASPTSWRKFARSEKRKAVALA